jgi:uncharacterized membrane protein
MLNNLLRMEGLNMNQSFKLGSECFLKKNLLGVGIFIITVFITIFFYQKQLGAIPLLLLAVFLIYQSVKTLKNNK